MTDEEIDRVLRNARPRPEIDAAPRMLAYVAVALAAAVVAVLATALALLT